MSRLRRIALALAPAAGGALLAGIGFLSPIDGVRLAAVGTVVVGATWVWDRYDLGPTFRRDSFERAVRAQPSVAEEARPASLLRLERLVSLHATEADLHFGLRPPLRELAAQRLRHLHGVDLDHDHEAAARLLGPELYELTRADRPLPHDRRALATTSERDVLAFIETLEGL